MFWAGTAAIVLDDITPVGNAQQHIVRFVVSPHGKIALVRRDDRQAPAVSEFKKLGFDVGLFGEPMPLQLDVKTIGGELRAMFTGGAFMEPSTLQFFYDLGVPVANGYGLTEAGTVLTLNDLKPFRADTVGKPLPGVELRVLNPDSEGMEKWRRRARL